MFEVGAMGDPWAQFGTKAGSMVQVGKALSTLGYSNWSALEPGEYLFIILSNHITIIVSLI